MKTNKILALAFGLFAMFFINSCVEDDDFSTPELTVAPVDVASLGDVASFSNIVARYDAAVADGDQVGVFSVENEDPLYAIGYVVSDDGAGNFFEEIIVQNSIDENDPANDVRRGLKIEINTRDLGGFYNFGRKVYIKLNGLAIGEENGVYTLGKSSGNSLVQLEEAEFKDFIIRDPEVATITPKMVAIEDLVENDENTFIQLANSQIILGQENLTYAGEESDNFDGFRTITNCDTNATISLQTSTFADFKGAQLPQGKGTISGVYSRDFGDDFSVMIVNSINDINFNDPNRCDPVILDCGTLSMVGANNLFNDDFESETNNQLVTGNGWTNFIEAGTEGWEAYTQSGTNASQGRSARVGSFNSGDASTVAWLITPAIDLAANNGVTISFETSNSFADGSEMELLFSTNWDGTTTGVTTAEWGILPAAYIAQDSDFFGSWLESGNVDLNCGEGSTMHIAFKYTGSGQSGFDGTYELDNVSIDAN